MRLRPPGGRVADRLPRNDGPRPPRGGARVGRLPGVGVRLPARLEEVEDLGGDRVFAVLSLTGRDKTTGREMSSRFYDIFTIRDGMIGRLEEYTSRGEAFGDNAEKLRAFWKAWNPGGEMDMSTLDADVVYEDTNLPDHIGEMYRGHEGIARAAERWLEAYESLTLELERIAGAGRPPGVDPPCPHPGAVHRHRRGGAARVCLDLPRRQGHPLPFIPRPRRGSRPARGELGGGGGPLGVRDDLAHLGALEVDPLVRPICDSIIWATVRAASSDSKTIIDRPLLLSSEVVQ